MFVSGETNSFATMRSRQLRDAYVETAAPSVKAVDSQYLTPESVARRAVGLFSKRKEPAACLDLGSGTGILGALLVERFLASSLTLVDKDAEMMDACKDAFSRASFPVRYLVGDVFSFDDLGLYDRIILNPPYRKMRADDSRLASLPVRVPNLYAAFLCIAITHLAPGGEVVAIVPRSWMNGRYFAEFRKWLLASSSLDAMVVYESRKEVFADSQVLQEIMIVKFSKRPQASSVDITVDSTSVDRGEVERIPFERLVLGEDRIVGIAPLDESDVDMLTLREAGFCASTGKVVDFRQKESLSFQRADQFEIPLLYPCNLQNGKVEHPMVSPRKPQWMSNADASRFVLPAGSYVLVKRFSPKEERQRIQAFELETKEPVAVENHVNVIHAGTPRKIEPLKKSDASFLASVLNSAAVNEFFSHFSGSTQVNASDLNRLPINLGIAHA